MQKSLIAATVAISAFSAMSVSASNGVYVSGKLGVSIVNTHDSHSKFVDDGDVLNETKISNKNKGTFGGNIAVGYDFFDQYQLPMRVEIDSTFRGKGESNGNTGSIDYINDNGQPDSDSIAIKNKVRMNTYMLNTYYDYHNESSFTPYVSAGVGISHLKLDNSTSSSDGSDDISGSKNNFAWGLGAGVKYDVTSNIAIDAGYKYINGGKVDASRAEDGFSYKSKLKASSHDLMIGVAYKF